MKKLINKFLFVLVLLLVSTNVNAKVIDKNDIFENSYVIGNHIFTENTILTTKHIMLASKTIGGNSLDNMTIYYKAPGGIWMDGLTGDILNVPDSFEVYYQDETKIEEVQYGDVNSDGLVNRTDLLRLAKYFMGWNVEINSLNADVNNDGRVSEADMILLKKYFSNYYPEKNLPNEPLGTSYIIEYMAEEETYFTDYELEGYKLSKPTDPTKSGYTFAGWYVDETFNTVFDFENTKVTDNIVLYAKFVDVRYGDVNNDGKVDYDDLKLLVKYVHNSTKMNSYEKTVSDLNSDGQINMNDIIILHKHIGGIDGYNTIPVDVERETLIYGDINGDDKVPEEDAMYLFQYSMFPETYPLSKEYTLMGDVNLDGNIDISDSIIIKYYINREIGYENLPLYDSPKVETKYGDVNNDDKVDYDDLKLLVKYVHNSTKMNSYEKTVSDLNGDGQINMNDIIILHKHLGGIDGYNTIPVDVEKETLIYGDVNGDGKVTKEDATYCLYFTFFPDEYPLSKESALMADVNLDGEITDKDAVIINYYINREKGYENLPLYDSPEIKVKYGDINNDGKVDYDDLKLLVKYVNNSTKMNSYEKTVSDLNSDGQINMNDIIILHKHLGGIDGYNTIPVDVEKETLIYGDINGDERVTEEDAMYLFQYSMFPETYPLSKEYVLMGDVNLDGNIDISDSIIIKYYINREKGYENLPLYDSQKVETKYGDVNNDGKVDYDDLKLLVKYVHNSTKMNSYEKTVSDLNCDGQINMNDIIILH